VNLLPVAKEVKERSRTQTDEKNVSPMSLYDEGRLNIAKNPGPHSAMRPPPSPSEILLGTRNVYRCECQHRSVIVQTQSELRVRKTWPKRDIVRVSDEVKNEMRENADRHSAAQCTVSETFFNYQPSE
jgi:hypothetical protein